MGGCSAEREVSLRSGAAVAAALERSGHEVLLVDLTSEALPAGLDPARDVVFPVLHGGWGEGGGVQAALEEGGFAFVGCDAESSRTCMDKPSAKEAARRAGVPVARDRVLRNGSEPTASELVAALGEEIVLKPAAEGSSVGLAMLQGEEQAARWLAQPHKGVWLAEERVRGRELTCGVLAGRAMGVVEIAPRTGVYDYSSKYTVGASQYLFPAPIGEAATARVQELAAAAFRACGCRDFARIDFILPPSGEPVFLEVNTIPGMTQTSLLPKSASCVDLDFDQLVRAMLAPALTRRSCPAYSL